MGWFERLRFVKLSRSFRYRKGFTFFFNIGLYHDGFNIGLYHDGFNIGLYHDGFNIGLYHDGFNIGLYHDGFLIFKNDTSR